MNVRELMAELSTWDGDLLVTECEGYVLEAVEAGDASITLYFCTDEED